MGGLGNEQDFGPGIVPNPPNQTSRSSSPVAGAGGERATANPTRAVLSGQSDKQNLDLAHRGRREAGMCAE